MKRLSKNFLSLFLFVVLVFYSCTQSNSIIPNQTNELSITPNANFSVNEGYELTLSPMVRIHVGGAYYDKKLSEIKNGTSAGGITISADQIKKLEENIGKNWKLEINKYGVLNLRELVLTKLNTSETAKGIYNVENRMFLLGNGSTESYNNGKCGTIGLGVVKGNISVNGDEVTGGEIGFTLLTGCNPVVVGINITFYYTAKRIPNGTGIPFTNTTTSWSVPQDAGKIKDALIAKRWKFNFYANKGNVITPNELDFIQFYSNGTADLVILGQYEQVKWKYNETNKSIEITNSANVISYYFLQNLDDKLLQVYTPTDEFRFKEMVKPNATISTSLSNQSKMLTSGRWKIQSIKAGILTLSPKVSDFTYFYPDGFYEQSVLGFYAKGTWKWENSEKRIYISSTIGNMGRNVSSLSQTKLELIEGNEGGVFIR